MALKALGEWVTVNSVVKLTSNDTAKAPVYKGDAFRVPTGVTEFAEGDEIHFRDSEVTSIYHEPTEQDFYFVQKENVILYNN